MFRIRVLDLVVENMIYIGLSLFNVKIFIVYIYCFDVLICEFWKIEFILVFVLYLSV